jgi:ribosomal subunit interface protein
MFAKFEIQGVHTVLDDKLRAYVTKKIGNLDRYVARNYRPSAHLEVHLKETKRKGDNHCICEVNLHLPKQNIVIKESSVNMYATA